MQYYLRDAALEDAYLLWEIIAVTAHNEWLATKHEREKAKRK